MTRQEAMEISRRATERFEKTREIQWKFNISFWTLISAGIYHFGKNNIKFNLGELFFLFGGMLFAHGIFIVRSQISLASSKMVTDYIDNELSIDNCESRVIKLNVDDITKKAKIKGRGIGWFAFQLIATVVLLLLFVILNYRLP